MFIFYDFVIPFVVTIAYWIAYWTALLSPCGSNRPCYSFVDRPKKVRRKEVGKWWGGILDYGPGAGGLP